MQATPSGNTIGLCQPAEAHIRRWCLSVSSAASAQQRLPDLSLEELMSWMPGSFRRVRTAPAGHRGAGVGLVHHRRRDRPLRLSNLADILRSVRGLYVCQRSQLQPPSARAGSRSRATTTAASSCWSTDTGSTTTSSDRRRSARSSASIPPMFERVEIIRGPASSLYGDSAFFAVVNVITRSGASLNGAAVTLEVGTLGARLARASAGHRLANGVDVAVSGTYEQSTGVGRLYFPVFDTPATNNGVAEGLDGEGVSQFYGHLASRTDVDRRLRHAGGATCRPPRSAPCSTSRTARSRRPTVTRCSMPSTGDVRRHARDVPSLLRPVLLRRHLSVCRANRTADAGRARQRLGTRWSVGGGLTRALRGRQTVTRRRRVHRQRPSGPGEPLHRSAPLLLDADRSSMQHARLCSGRDQARPVAHRERRAPLRWLRGVHAGSRRARR